ncbi:CHAT domain-containing protein [Streptosporangium sp. NBC_01469]|uniref:CHAT domain-containing protein n=1 Tax=Streptosporangium sp. NBC_01469 TaxID=2903898 RepID=UPI002E2CBB85|nr:CHAT domain-containing protein [Streptosporangium sp. NBC_01469]
MTGLPNRLRRALLGGGRPFNPRAAENARGRGVPQGGAGAERAGIPPVGSAGAEAAEPPPLPPTPVELNAGLPPGTAILKVWKDSDAGRESYGLQGVCCCGIALAYQRQPQQVRPSRLTLGDLIHRGDDGESPTKTLIRLRTWSKDASEGLKGFLSEIRRAHGDDVHMIIEDVTGYGLPWELLRHRDKGLAEAWLGALFPIARSVGTPTTVVTRCTGEILTYVAPDMAGDRALLDRFRTTTRDVPLKTLVNVLDTEGDPVSLVYVACHGEYEKTDTPRSKADMRLIEGPRGSEHGISLREIHAHDLLRLEQAGGLVFLNACHSARERVDPDLDNTTLRSFAKVFLDAGASGFIGTMGEVGREHGYDLAKALLETLTDNPDIPVAVALRDYRRRAAAPVVGVPREDDNEAGARLLPFFYAFMYAYFGNPKTTLRPREEIR